MILDRLVSIKNKGDFFLRKLITFKLPIDSGESPHTFATYLQEELQDFLKRFNWVNFAENRQNEIVIADVGTRTFAIAPVIDDLFRQLGYEPTVHGIEIDAFRRFTNFRSRADYGAFYATQISNGFFHPIDFLKFNKPCDLIFMLNPFVTKGPLLKWGLPLTEFKPRDLFNHAACLLKENKGHLVISSPTPEELQISLELAKDSNFSKIEEQTWEPSATTIQRQKRYGAMLKLKDL